MNMNMGTDVSNELDLAKSEVLTDSQAYKEKLRNLPEVQKLTKELNIDDANTILHFGQSPSVGISQTSDMILNSMKKVKAEEATQMIGQLTKIMKEIDLDELENAGADEKQGVLKRIFKKVQKTIEELFSQYESMGKEIDKVHMILKQFENDIRKTNDDLAKQYKANITFLEELEKYVVAGELGLEQMEAFENQLKLQEGVSEQDKQMQLNKLAMLKDMLSQRVMDLRIAENIAIQTAPMIQNSQMSNFNLMRKINSAFIITLPVFKQAMVQAIQLKRQEIQARSLAQLDATTNELLERNARNNATQSVAIAKMAGGTSISMETLRKTYQTIQDGIAETNAINEENARARVENTVELENMKVEMQEKGFLISAE